MDEDLVERAHGYANRRGIDIDSQAYGFGQDGSIWKSKVPTALKVFQRPEAYSIELACYRRLAEREISEIHGFVIPGLVDFDDELRVIEMDLVSPPYLLDFGKCYLDRKADFSPEVWHDWEEEYAELWEGRWREVKRLLWRLESYGIYYVDPKPGNIRFAD